MGISTIKPHEGMDTPDVWRGVFRLFKEMSRANQPVDEYGYWDLNEEQTQRFRSFTRSSSEACIVAWQDAYKETSTRELRKILQTPKQDRHLRVIKDSD